MDNLNLNLDFSTEESSIANQDSLLQWAETLRSSLDYSQFDDKQSAVDFLINSATTAEVTTDKGDYSPGETALISGTGFELGETVQFQVLHTDGRDNSRAEHQPWQITDGDSEFDEAGNIVGGDLDGVVDGNIETSWFVDPFDSLNSRFELTAEGLDSGAIATTNFTDSYVISGTVFNDYNSDGENDGTTRGFGFASESGVEGITITAYNAAEVVVGTATTGADGTYTLNINTDDPVRVEFTLPTGFVSTSLAGVANNVTNDTVSDIAFTSTAATMDLGIHRPHEVTSGDGSSIQLITVCYVEGIGGSGASGIIIHGYNDAGSDDSTPASPAYTALADFDEVGTVNGLAYHRESSTLFAGSFYKRHSALLGTINSSAAAADTSVIYTIASDGTVTEFATLDNVTDPRGAIDGATYNWDTDGAAFAAVGKTGLGDVELSADGTTLWTINLNDNQLYQLPVGDSSTPLTPTAPATGDIESFDFITDIINNGDDLGVNPAQNIRPFALSTREGLVYIGMVNTAQYDASGVEGNTTAADLRAFVYTFDPANPTATPTQVLDIPLNYERDHILYDGASTVLSGDWNPWTDTFPTTLTPVFSGDEVVYAQPILSDIDFDPDGNMLLGFRDRWGDQVGFNVTDPDGNDNYSADAGGDLLQAVYNANTDSWTIETHVTTDGVNGNNDPDGEFFRNELLEDGAPTDSQATHAETGQGGLTVIPGFNEVVTTALDPTRAFSGGFEWFDTTNGDFAGHFVTETVFFPNFSSPITTSGLELFLSRNPNGGGTDADTFAKANGLGDLEFIAAASDIEVGNRIWDDTNQDGIQNADETNFDFVGNGTGSNDTITIELYDGSGSLIDTETTTNGEYYFSGLDPFTDYEIRLAASNFNSGAPLDGYLATLQNANSDGSDRIDSDATNSGGVPSISFTTGASGSNDYSFDFGLVNAPTTDYGDAPDPTSGTGEGDYQTTAANTGASHTIVSGITIGSGITADDGTLQNSDATADSDDGVTFTSTLQTNDTSFSVDVEVNVTGSTTLVGWIDFDQSGTFDADEAVSTTVTGSGTETLTWNSFPGIIDGATYARFRLSTDGLLDTSYSTGAAIDGEVEDYLITIGLDYGDAPDASSGTGTGNYQTTSSDTGASHGIINGLSIGSTVDPDNGTLQNVDADNDNTDGSDDEDGVTFTSNLSITDTSYSVDVDVTNTTGNAAALIGWIDFDQDGIFETGEASNIATVSSSGTQTLTWTGISPTAGTTYARFRLSTDTATLTTSYSTDALVDGEVEDYQINVGVDYGDAPDTSSGTGAGDYQTTADNNGASHVIDTNLSLGGNIDADDGTLQNTDATADDIDNTDDEDGVTFTSNLELDDTSYSVTVDINNDTGSTATLIGWIDFDQSGTFDSDEATTATFAADATSQTFTWSSIPSDITYGTTYARFRLSTDVNLDSNFANGALTDGEVEDYKLTVGLDYGDARDTGIGTATGDYSTTANDNGPSHIIDPDLSIGTSVDADDGTLQNTGATADDDALNDGSTDDEDGVSFPNDLRTDSTSYSVTINSINNDTGNNAELIGWIDFDQSGTFDSDEATTATFSADATSQTFTWSSIPDDITDGDTYVRFRLSTDSNLDTDFSTGQLSDGEVEDYEINIIGIDYGDAPDTVSGASTGDYDTTLADGGASHTITDGLKLGATVDAENGTLQNTAATADDLDNNNDDNDEDGVTFNSTLDVSTTSFSVSIDYTNDTGGDAIIVGWIDFDQSGTFDADEAVSSATLGTSVFDQSTTLTWTSFPEITAGTTYARFRLNNNTTNLTINTATGELDGGEVEDYQIIIEGGTDFGDAPDSYGTLIASSGASHGIVDGLNIGSLVDAESDGQDTTGADGDDNNDTDDEDGVTFASNLETTDTEYTVTVDVVANGGSTISVSDDFSSGGYTGGTGWSNNWTESGESNGSGTLDAFIFNNQLAIVNGVVSLSRQFDFSSASGDATLTFDYSQFALDATETYLVQIDDGLGGTPQTVFTVDNSTTSSTAVNTASGNITIPQSLLTSTTTITVLPGVNIADGGAQEAVIIDNINITAPVSTSLVGWIDFDGDGSFEASEGTSVTVTGSGEQTLTWDLSSFSPGVDIVAGDTYARFRLSTDSFNENNPTGSLTNGEVEDYQITINGTDYGDAPDTGTGTGTGNYQTTELDDGAAHIIVSGLSLGSIAPDADNGTLQNNAATADDNNSTDDEDGVDFTAVSNLRVVDSSYSIDVNVTNTTGSNAVLVGWIDFDQSGTFDSDEAVTAAANSNGTVNLNWSSIPSDILPGTTYARFRISNDTTTLTTSYSTGLLTSGEVEDYAITIDAADYGDAPDTASGTATGDYSTTASDGGAAHGINRNLFLGSNLDADDGTQQNDDADADDQFTLDQLNYEYFDLANRISSVNEIPESGADVVGTLDPDNDLVANADQGDTEDFGIRYTGFINITTAGTYTFYTTSDDGSTLSIEDTLVVNNDGAHSSETQFGDFTFPATGYYPIAVEFFEATGTQSLTLEYESTDASIARQNIPGSVLAVEVDDEDGVTSTLTDIQTGDTSYSITLDAFNNTGSNAELIGWIDFDRSGTFDSDEAVIRTISSDANPSSVTLTWDNNGNGFTSEDISEGVTYARFRLSSDTTTLTTSYSTGNLTDGEVEDYQINIIGVDYGDAPDDGLSGNSAGDYQTTRDNGGASHIIIDDLYLGGSVDADDGTLEDRDAIADDNDNTDDEDGVIFNNILSNGNNGGNDYVVDLVVTNETGSNTNLVGWIDFDQDGNFEASEAVTQTVPHAIGGQNTTLTWTGLSGVVGGTTYARFRLTSDGDLDLNNIQESDSIGQFDSGEVEDYQLPVQGGVDYGDAPDAVVGAIGVGTGTGEYKTTLADGGPSHSIVSNLFIGDTVDEDDGTLQGSSAIADDNDGINDEDGVNFLATLEEGDTDYSVTVDLTNDTGNNATLVGWIDFDQDGNFEASEAATAIVSSSSSEQTATLTWNSITPIAGETYARFRLSTDSALDTIEDGDSLGLLSDGEVEDYHICVVSSGGGGTDGADVIVADPGGSVIAGYKGQDTLTGGAGVDHFCYSESSDSVDIVNGFTVGVGGDQIILTQILRDEIGYTGNNPIGDGYVVLVDHGTTGTMVQIDFDGSLGSLLPKDLTLVVDTGNLDINETILGDENLIF